MTRYLTIAGALLALVLTLALGAGASALTIPAPPAAAPASKPAPAPRPPARSPHAAPAPRARARAPRQIFGLGDENDPQMFATPAFRRLDVQATRYVAHWDVALRAGYQRQRVDTWYRAAVAARLRPLLSFGGQNYNVIPSAGQFRHAFLLALRRWPRVETWETWNEANHYTEPVTYRHPARAAMYARIMRQVCPRCHLLPLSIVFTGGAAAEDGWIASWSRAFGAPAPVYAINDYTDPNFQHVRTLASFLRRHPRGKIWLVEEGAFAKFSVQFPWSLRRQAASAPWIIKIALAFPTRVSRVYYYQWRGSPYGRRQVGWDTGLLTVAGKPRPAYYQLLRVRHQMR